MESTDSVLARKAKAACSEIYWGDEAGARSDAPKGTTLVVRLRGESVFHQPDLQDHQLGSVHAFLMKRKAATRQTTAKKVLACLSERVAK